MLLGQHKWNVYRLYTATIRHLRRILQNLSGEIVYALPAVAQDALAGVGHRDERSLGQLRGGKPAT